MLTAGECTVSGATDDDTGQSLACNSEVAVRLRKKKLYQKLPVTIPKSKLHSVNYQISHFVVFIFHFSYYSYYTPN